MKRLLDFALTISLAGWLAAGCGSSGSSAKEQEEKIPVEVTTVALGNVVQNLNYSGDIKAEYEVSVFSKIYDRIEQFYADEGDYIKKDSPIAKIIATTTEQSVKQAEAALAAARSQEANMRVEYERAQRLNREDAMSKQQYDAIKTQYESIQAQVEQARAVLASMQSQLNDATVTAPISGIIGKRYYENGDMAAPSAPLVTIVQMRRVKIEFNATEEDLGKLKVGQKTAVSVKAYPHREFSGKVLKISPVLDPTTRMAEVEVLVDNADGLLKPGMYAQAEVTTGVIKNVIVVPRYVTIENTTLETIAGEDRVVKNYFVFVVDSNRAVQKKLDVSYVNHKSIAVSSGINVGDILVVAGQNNLRDGLPVSIVNKENPL
ncbi:MAG: efflux RND transporter periplasmic adaptor subunit [Calditrichia bacterium]